MTQTKTKLRLLIWRKISGLTDDEDVFIVIEINAHPSLFKSIVSLFAVFLLCLSKIYSFFCLLNFLLFHNLCKLFSILFWGRFQWRCRLIFKCFPFVGALVKKEEDFISVQFLWKINSMLKDNICCDKRLRKGIICHNSFAYNAKKSAEKQIFLRWWTVELIRKEMWYIFLILFCCS